MLKGLFIDKTGMLAQQRRLEVSANNLANINTTGYKREKVFFRQLLDEAGAETSTDSNRRPGLSAPDFSGGALRATDRPLDVAITGKGFFVVNANGEELYTRNGNFSLNEEGTLVNFNGLPVATDGGELQLAGKDIRITDDGAIFVDGNVAGRLRIAGFEPETSFERIGDTYFRSEATPVDLELGEYALEPGYLETSNVEPIQEMIAMIEINRLYELGQKAISTQDQTLDQLINQAGRL